MDGNQSDDAFQERGFPRTVFPQERNGCAAVRIEIKGEPVDCANSSGAFQSQIFQLNFHNILLKKHNRTLSRMTVPHSSGEPFPRAGSGLPA